jgi:hypothetical protein
MTTNFSAVGQRVFLVDSDLDGRFRPFADLNRFAFAMTIWNWNHTVSARPKRQDSS